MTKLIITRNDGLGARLCNIVIGLYIAKKYNLEYSINWEKNCKNNIFLNELITNLKFTKINSKKLMRISKPNIEIRGINKIGFILKDKNKSYKHFIYTHHKILITKEEFYNIFKSFQINKNITHITNIFKVFELKNIVGVHVRRGDIVKHRLVCHRNRCIKNEVYYKFLDERNIKLIFLCSDSEQIYNDFGKKYKIIRYYHRELTRNSSLGIQDAFIDMILLSQCKYIIGGHSKFSQCASCIGNNELIILKN